MKMLITGASGKLGTELAKLFPGAITPSHKEMDITDPNQVNYYLKNKIEVVVHLAALTSPPICERNKELAWKTNVVGTTILIQLCQLFNVNKFILMSTPCVFNGDDETHKKEWHRLDPDNYYGFTKAIQETLVIGSNLEYLIIRGNFISYKKYPYPRAFTDRYSNYLFAHQLAKGIKDAIEFEDYGIIHILGDKIISMYELAKRCPDSEDVKPYTLKEYYMEHSDSPKLTKNMVLESTRWRKYDIGEI